MVFIISIWHIHSAQAQIGITTLTTNTNIFLLWKNHNWIITSTTSVIAWFDGMCDVYLSNQVKWIILDANHAIKTFCHWKLIVTTTTWTVMIILAKQEILEFIFVAYASLELQVKVILKTTFVENNTRSKRRDCCR